MRTRSEFGEVLGYGLPIGILAAWLAVFSIQKAPLLAPVFLATAVLAGIALLRPLWAVYVALASIPLEVFTLDLGALGLTLSEAAFMGAAAGWIGALLVQRAELPPPTALAASLALLIAAIVPGLFISQDLGAVIKELVVWSGFYAVFLMVTAEGDTQTVQNVLVILGIAGGAVGLLGILGEGQEPAGRAVGSFTHPNALGIFLAVAIPAQLVIILRGPQALRPFMALALALATGGIALSLSRGAFLGVFGGLTVMLLWAPLRRAIAVVAVVAAIFILTGFNPVGRAIDTQAVLGRISSITDKAAAPARQRTQIYHESPKMIRDHPLGVGADSFPKVGPDYGLIDETNGQPFGHAHNLVLGVGTELGVIGLIALAALTVALVSALIRACRDLTGRERAFAFALAAAFMALALQGLVDYVLSVNAIAGTMFVLLGCVAILARKANHGQPSAPTPQLRADTPAPRLPAPLASARS